MVPLVEEGYLCAHCGVTLAHPTGFPTACEECYQAPLELPLYVIGVDTGARGAAAHGEPGEPVQVFDLVPHSVRFRGTKYRNVADLGGLLQIIESKRDTHRICVFLETLVPKGSNGSNAAVQSGRIFGRIEGAAIALGCEVEGVDPEQWKTHHEIASAPTYDGRKEASIVCAEQLFPHLGLRPAPRLRKGGGLMKVQPRRTAHSDRAEAVLIWAYGVAQIQKS